MSEDPGIAIIESMFDDSTSVDHETLVFAQTLFNESDRGCVLAAAAYLDDELKLLLCGTFKDSQEVVKKAVGPLLQAGIGPLGSFWAKIKIAFALGLIDSKIYDGLDAIRELRNSFAHKAGPVELSDPRVTPILRTLDQHVQKIAKTFKLLIEKEIAKIHTAASATGQSVSIPRGICSLRIQFTLAVLSIGGKIARSGSQVR